MRIFVLTLILATLAACGTPQEQCINAQTRDLRVVNGLIAESRATLARGYAIETVTVTVPVWQRCEPVLRGDGKPGKKPRPRRLCLEDQTQTTRRPRAIDLAAEQRILTGLLAKQGTLEMAAAPALAGCRAQYPE